MGMIDDEIPVGQPLFGRIAQKLLRFPVNKAEAGRLDIPPPQDNLH
jgi:hypothetical protein